MSKMLVSISADRVGLLLIATLLGCFSDSPYNSNSSSGTSSTGTDSGTSSTNTETGTDSSHMGSSSGTGVSSGSTGNYGSSGGEASTGGTSSGDTSSTGETGESCIAPMLMCGNDCVDPSNNALHCGACDNACNTLNGIGGCLDSECLPAPAECFQNNQLDCYSICLFQGLSCAENACGGNGVWKYYSEQDCESNSFSQGGGIYTTPCANLKHSEPWIRCCCV